MNFEQIDGGFVYANHHPRTVKEKLLIAEDSYPPTLEEDKNNPHLWKPAHWLWFAENHCRTLIKQNLI